jgi:hypothetical protein
MNWVDLLIQVLQPVALAVGTLFAAYLVSLARQYTSRDEFRELAERGVEVAALAVYEVQQAFVDGVKAGAADGKLTIEDATVARNLAFDRASELLGPKGIKLARRVLGTDDEAIENWIVALIEREVARLKAPKPIGMTVTHRHDDA